MAPRFLIRDISIEERPVTFRTPFRFGAVTVEAAPQVFIHAEIELEDGRRALGAGAELMVPKWFNKDPRLTAGATIDELRRALAAARALYLERRRADTAFGHHAAIVADQVADCAARGIPPLAAGFGPAEIDKALLDALLRALDRDVFAGLAANVAGLDARLTPDLSEAEIAAFLASRRPATRIAIRHTVGMLDSMDSLQEAIEDTGCRYFKLKLGGDPQADCDRLGAIAALLAARGHDYRATLDANEQYADRAALQMLIDTLIGDRDLTSLTQRLLYIEQPLPRDGSFAAPLGTLAERFAFIIDEADAGYDSFPQALALGYRGVSSKSCKGLYKSLVNGARAAKHSAAGTPCFLAAEDLTCQAGLAVQQDTALAAFLGITHAERNGHHYVDGFADIPDAEAFAFLAAHPDLYEDIGGQVRLRIAAGSLAIASLAQPGFASGVAPDRVGPRTDKT